ncbi:MAG: acetolactate synthase small subunit [Candidatus Diapherotrites archaeon]
MEKFIIKLIVDNTKGVMARIATLLSRKGYNITSIAVGSHLEEGEASIMLTIWGNETEVELAKNMLEKLINVIDIHKYHESEVIEKEHCLLKIKKTESPVAKLNNKNVVVLRENEGIMVLEYIDHPDKVEALITTAVKELDVLDISRSGTNAMSIK